MNATFKKLVAAAAIAGGLAASSLGAATPAAADGRGWGHGWGHGGHGWGYGRAGYGWGGHRHGGWGAPVAAGVLGALAVGAAIGAAQQPAYGYNPCYLADQPITDDWGDVVAYRRVQVCN